MFPCMALIVTEAIVLHAFDYLESSRILRLVTREAGVQSVMARGARRPRTRFGTALDLFVEGIAHFSARRGRELHTLTSFEVARTRPRLAEGFGRFTGASAIAELALRFGGDEPHPDVYEAVSRSLDALAAAGEPESGERALAGAWAVVSALGFTPSLLQCATCDRAVPDDASAAFSPSAGGVLCATCAALARGTRTLPADARRVLEVWQQGGTAPLPDEASARAHQRLLREFVQEHLAEGRPLRAFSVWEHERWSA
jgi:DNA repair protein RecO (recombination protein O)